MLWSIIAGLGLASLWHTREDGIWIIPLVFGVIIVTWFSVFLKKGLSKLEKSKKNAIVSIPIVILLLSTFIISSINYGVYGIFTTNELNNSNFTETIKLMYSVASVEEVARASVPRSTMEKFYEVSPTLNQVSDEINSSLDRWSRDEKDVEVRQVEDGFFFWSLREAVSNAGYYQNARMANEFYKNVSSELEAGFEDGKLMQRPTMPSALMSPWRDEYWEKLPLSFLYTVHYVVGFEAVETTITDSVDDGKNGIRLFEQITNNLAQYPGEKTGFADQVKVEGLNFITAVYQFFGVFVFLLAIAAYIFISILLLLKKWREKYRLLDFWLVLTALLCSAFVLFIGVAYTDISAYVAVAYWYLAGAYPLVIAFNGIALYKAAEIIIISTFDKNSKAKIKLAN